MIIFQRQVTFEGPQTEIVPWAMEITELVNEKSEANASLWQAQFGLPIGTLTWSCLLENLTVLEHVNETLAVDAGYLSLEAKARDWVSAPGEDRLYRMAHTAGGEYVRPEVGAYAEGTRAVPAEGKMGQAAVFGAEIADMHSSITHSSVLFCTSAYGAFGEMAWLALFDSATAVDAAAEAIAKDDEYMAKLDAAGDLFQPGTAERMLARRIT